MNSIHESPRRKELYGSYEKCVMKKITVPNIWYLFASKWLNMFFLLGGYSK